MNLADLAILYAAGGVVSAVLLQRRSRERGARAIGGAVLCLALWPLWLPVKLADDGRGSPARFPALGTTEAALLEGHAAVRGTPLEPLLPRDAVERILSELRRAAARGDELAALLGRTSFGLESARERVERLAHGGGSPRALASARLHLENVERLGALKRRDDLALEELAELVSALRTQLVLARYAGSSPEGAGDIVSEVWARVETLGTTMDDSRAFVDT
jgi:hypothetical protein